MLTIGTDYKMESAINLQAWTYALFFFNNQIYLINIWIFDASKSKFAN